jgi:hypothetical protein
MSSSDSGEEERASLPKSQRIPSCSLTFLHGDYICKQMYFDLQICEICDLCTMYSNIIHTTVIIIKKAITCVPWPAVELSWMLWGLGLGPRLSPQEMPSGWLWCDLHLQKSCPEQPMDTDNRYSDVKDSAFRGLTMTTLYQLAYTWSSFLRWLLREWLVSIPQFLMHYYTMKDLIIMKCPII